MGYLLNSVANAVVWQSQPFLQELPSRNSRQKGTPVKSVDAIHDEP